MQICTIPLTSILVEDRLRSVDAERAAQIALSFREAGQITPIEVTPEGADGLHRLIAGAHRVEAARLAGMDVIQAVIFEGSEDAGRLREIDENLYRRELSDLDRAAFLAERLAVHERLFGALKKGRKRNDDKMSHLNFYADVAAKFGLNKKTVQRSLQRRRLIEPGVWQQLGGTRFAENGALLDAIARLVPMQQMRVVAMLIGGTARTVGDALVALGVKAPVEAEQQQLQALMAAWRKAEVPARGQFIGFLVKESGASLRKALRRAGEGEGE